MTDQINDQISAFIDNELSAEESALLVRRFERDPEVQARATRYTLIGAALRGELLEPHPSVLRQRVTAALNGAVPGERRSRESLASRALQPLVGFGIAATVALVAIGTLRSMNEVAPSPTSAVVSDAPAVLYERVAEDAPSYVVPRDVAEGRAITPPVRLTNYLMHHGVYASGVTRTTVNSNVVGATTELPLALPAAEPASAAKPIILDDAAPE